MYILENIIYAANDFLWGFFMIVLLFGTHLYMSVKTKFIQKKTFYAIKLSVSREEGAGGDVSPFQALTTSLASTIGTGNIIGVGTAIFLGGPGAVFWCWLCGIFGMATKYAESLIAVKYRVKTKDGGMAGGAMYVLENRLGYRKLAIAFALFAVTASLGVGCGVQINAISEVCKNNISFISISPEVVGIVFAVLTAVVIIGGIKSIGKVCEKVIPLAAGLYLLGNIIILAINYDYIFLSLKAIFTMAFTPGAAAGGLVGQGIICAARYGIARGLFSNESGMGSAPIVASAAQTKDPVRQALVSSTGTFWDTVVLCFVTGVVIVSTIMKNPQINMDGIANGAQMTTAAFSQIPVFGSFVLIFGIIVFAYSTILGWAYYGERCFAYLFGEGKLFIYKIIFIFVVLKAPLMSADLIWTLSDVLNALMAIPNLIAVLMLAQEIKTDTEKYLNSLTTVRFSDRIKKKIKGRYK